MVIGLGPPTPLTPPPWPEKWCLTTLIQWISGLDGEEDGVPDLEGTFCSGAHFLDVALSKTLIWYTVCIIWCYSPPSSACFFFFLLYGFYPSPWQPMGGSVVSATSQSQSQNTKRFLAPPNISITFCSAFSFSLIFPTVSQHTCSMSACLRHCSQQ